MAKGKDVAVKEQISGVVAALNDLQMDGGFVEVRKELIRIPRLQLGQALSDTVQAGLGKQGEFLSKVKGTNYGMSVKIIPILVSESAAFMPKGTKKLVCRSDNLITNTEGVPCKQCPHGQYWNSWDSNKGEGPECRTSIDVVCIVNDEYDMPQVISFRKTSFKAGKALLNLIMHDKYRVPFGSQYELKSTMATKDEYKFFVIEDSIQRTQLTEDQLGKIIPIAKQMLEMKKQGRLQHEDDDVDAVAKEDNIEEPPPPTDDDFPVK